MAKPISGNDGTAKFDATEFLQVRGWTLSDTSDNQAYVSSATKGQTRRVKGNQDWTATITIFFDEGKPPAAQKGEIGELELFTSETAAVGGVYAGAGIIDSVDPEDDIEGGTLVPATINMSADGAMVFTPNP